MGTRDQRLAASDVISLITREFPALKDEICVSEEPGGTRIEFPSAGAAEYIFQVWVYSTPPPTDLEISARVPSMDGHKFFWGRSFEAADFSNQDEMVAAFLSLLHQVLKHDTRVIQRRGILFWSYKLEIRREAIWEPLSGGVSFFRWSNMTVPNSDARRWEYQSAKLL